MQRFTQGVGYARFRFVNGIVFIAMGLFVVINFLHGIGLRKEAISGYVLGLAFVALGVLRLRAGWPRT